MRMCVYVYYVLLLFVDAISDVLICKGKTHHMK